VEWPVRFLLLLLRTHRSNERSPTHRPQDEREEEEEEEEPSKQKQ